MGFDKMNPIIHKFASVKGGKVRKAKGFASLSKEELLRVSSLGGKAKYANRDKRKGKSEEKGQRDDSQRLADISGDT